MTDVVCISLLDSGGALLACRRAPGRKLPGLWELPGGKLEPGESPRAALERELREELSLDLSGYELKHLEPVIHPYPFGTIRLLPFWCRAQERPNLVLHEHSEVRWLSPAEWHSVEWAPADIPVLSQL